MTLFRYPIEVQANTSAVCILTCRLRDEVLIRIHMQPILSFPFGALFSETLFQTRRRIGAGINNLSFGLGIFMHVYLKGCNTSTSNVLFLKYFSHLCLCGCQLPYRVVVPRRKPTCPVDPPLVQLRVMTVHQPSVRARQNDL